MTFVSSLQQWQHFLLLLAHQGLSFLTQSQHCAMVLSVATAVLFDSLGKLCGCGLTVGAKGVFCKLGTGEKMIQKMVVVGKGVMGIIALKRQLLA
eukprot:14872322-Ditylum_brightwellii.AAC.1